MTDWQERVVEEETALDEKIAKLEDFINSEKIGDLKEADQYLLKY